MSPRRTNTGGRIDRDSTVRFTFDGKPYVGHPGDTLASALLANGVSLFGRSFKYHRPRGVLAAGIDEPNALVTVLKGDIREPNIPATMLEIHDGLTVVSQNRFPSLAFDVGAVNQLAGKLLSAGFYYKTFMGPVIGPLKGTRFWMLCEHFIRRAAGLGRAGYARDSARYERMNAFCDVLVVGSGPAGLMAAKAAAERGARVILAELDPRFGGTANWSDETIDGMPAADWAARAVEELSEARQCPPAQPHHRLGLLRRQHACRARARHRPQEHRRQGRAAPSPLVDPCRRRRARRPAPSSGRWYFPATTGRASCWRVRPNATPTSSAWSSATRSWSSPTMTAPIARPRRWRRPAAASRRSSTCAPRFRRARAALPPRPARNC